MNERDVMVYLMTGFLESGKTDFLKFTLTQEYFRIEGTTLLILCEEGESEYDVQEMLKYDVKIEHIQNQIELTTEHLEELDRKYQPERVVVEYNGMWKVSSFEEMQLPEGWKMEQKMTTVDASTFQMYLTNLKPLFVEMVRDSEMVVFNRCTDKKPLAGYRRSVKVVSPQAEVIFEDENGEIENIFADQVPYDLQAPVIEIRKEDYGIWFVDVMEHPERYGGKTVEFTGQIMKSGKLPGDAFVPGRKAMTCCADDISFLGYICKTPLASNLRRGQWITLRANILFGRSELYRGGVGPVLNVESIEDAQPIKELVYFN